MSITGHVRASRASSVSQGEAAIVLEGFDPFHRARDRDLLECMSHVKRPSYSVSKNFACGFVTDRNLD